MCSFLDNRGEKSSSPSSKMNCASESDSSVVNYAKKLYWYGCFWLGITFPLSSWKIETSKCLGWPENSISTFSVSEAHKSIPAHHRSFFSRKPLNYPVFTLPFNANSPFSAKAPLPGRTAAYTCTKTSSVFFWKQFRANSETTFCNLYSIYKPPKPQQETRKSNKVSTEKCQVF